MKPILEYIDNKWELMANFPIDGYFHIPKGFRTDLASTPRILWSIYPPFGKYLTASVIHDYLYTTHLYPKAQCDLIFLHRMKEDGVDSFTRHLFYFAVSVFGNKHYYKIK